MASIEARYLAKVILDEKDSGDSDTGILSRTVFELVWSSRGSEPDVDALATVLQNRFPDGQVPTWAS